MSQLSIEQALSQEWLETNGLGGYASSTVLNAHTRKYHGLLVAATEVCTHRHVLLSRLEDAVVLPGTQALLSGAQYPGFLQEGSIFHLEHFESITHPRWLYQFGEQKVRKEILMPPNEQTVFVYYSTEEKKPMTLRIRPLLAMRDYHTLMHERSDIRVDMIACREGYRITPFVNGPTLFFQWNQSVTFCHEPVWYRQLEYLEEQKRGFDYQEDCFSPGIFVFKIDARHPLVFSTSTQEKKEDLLSQFMHEVVRRQRLYKKEKGSSLQIALKQKAKDFFIRGDKLDTAWMVAGYHWFSVWGRDTMIALPGLSLYTDQPTLCLNALKTFAREIWNGVLPNMIGSIRAEHAYNSVDTSLWFVWAVQQYYLKTKDIENVQTSLWPSLKEIYQNYKVGTLHHIGMKENGLLYAGSPQENLTWMDAEVDGVPVTPRYGFAVEVNALWFNALCFLRELANRFRETALQDELDDLSKKVKSAFLETFWNETLGFLSDVVNESGKDNRLRPNQIFAVSLPYSVVDRTMGESICKAVTEHLFTPYGLRSLSLKDPDYQGIYAGDFKTRDRTYHQGTVWPWLLGAYAEALLKVSIDKKGAQEKIQSVIEAMTEHLSDAGIGTISEIFDGEAPHLPRGCISQAFSVAEILRMTYLSLSI